MPKQAVRSLRDYEKKRDFAKTREPTSRRRKKSATTDRKSAAKKPIFVIQQHAARRLHWDFRLEADGVLKSWAVTKEPTMDPSVKRLAVHVEDHPFEYATFHGDIPKGQYGGGHVDIWDHGNYEPKGDVTAGIAAGKVEVNLHGKKLRGMFALVRMGEAGPKENWLLIKMKDEFAVVGKRKGKQSKVGNRTHGPDFGELSRVEARVTKSGESQKVEFTHVGKIMFPEAGITKGDVLKYYLKIADHLLPHLKDRPMTLERLPDGLAKPNSPRFWQKNTPVYYPKWIPRVSLPTEDGKRVDYLLVNDVDALAYVVNQGTITLHPFLSRVADLDRPDFVLFDLDPGEAKFSNVVKIANKLHELLDEQHVESFPKTSGKSGLHILTPWKQEGGYDKSRGWAESICKQVSDALPDIATVERSKSARNERVYVDSGQNARGKHVVPPYVVRAVPTATVSTPLDWDEVNAKLNPKKFTMDEVLKRVKREDPIAELNVNT
jgi:bifunctional non-homologous end joining protein LigD